MALVHTTFRSKKRFGRLSLLQYLLSANSVLISHFYFVWLIVLYPVFLYAATWRNKRRLKCTTVATRTSSAHFCSCARRPAPRPSARRLRIVSTQRTMEEGETSSHRRARACDTRPTQRHAAAARTTIYLLIISAAMLRLRQIAAVTRTRRDSCECRCVHSTIRYDTRCYFNVRSKADTSRLNLPLGTDN